MLIAARNAMMAGKRLPYDAEVEYLEGGSVDGGIAFIDTEFMPNTSTRIEATAAILTNTAYSGRFGDRKRLAFGLSGAQLYLAQGDHYYLGLGTLGRFYSFVNDIQNRTVSVDGATPTSTSAVANWYPQSYSFYLFVSNVAPIGGTIVTGHSIDPNSIGKMRIASCRIYDNGVLVRDYQPVRLTNEQGVSEGATYDRRGVGGMNPDGTARNDGLYFNRGTGAFVIGPDI